MYVLSIVICPFSFGHCVVCSSLIYGFQFTPLPSSNFSWTYSVYNYDQKIICPRSCRFKTMWEILLFPTNAHITKNCQWSVEYLIWIWTIKDLFNYNVSVNQKQALPIYEIHVFNRIRIFWRELCKHHKFKRQLKLKVFITCYSVG